MSEVEPVPIPKPRVEQYFAQLQARPVDDALGGMVYRHGSPDQMYAHSEIRQIMEQAGTAFQRTSVDQFGSVTYLSYIPNVARLWAATQRNKIPITLIEETSPTGAIPAAVYATAVRAHTHPVSTGTLQAYDHDTSQDHLPAIIVGGDELFSVMLDAMADVIDDDVQVSDRYDKATMVIRRAIFDLLRGSNMEDIDGALGSATAILVKGMWVPYDSVKTDERILEVDRRLRIVITNGLKRLGIEHRNILHKDDQAWHTRVLGSLTLEHTRP